MYPSLMSTVSLQMMRTRANYEEEFSPEVLETLRLLSVHNVYDNVYQAVVSIG